MIFNLTKILFKTILVLFLLSSCGDDGSSGQTSTVTFTKGFASSTSGGVIIYGLEETQGLSVGVALTSANTTSSTEMPAGDWKFFAVGWDGANNLEGKVRCGTVTKTLIGADNVSVAIDITNSGCADSNFTTDPVGEQFLPLRLISCSEITSITTSGSNCNSSAGLTKSFRLKMLAYNATTLKSNNTINSGIFSKCQVMQSSSYLSTSINLPNGPITNSPFIHGIDLYSSNDCSGVPISVVVNDALQSDIPGVAKLITTSSENELYVVHNATLSNAFVIGLTWGAIPLDLDAHLYVPNSSIPTEIYFGNKGSITSSPFALLAADDTTGFGPEVIGILKNGTGTFYGGTYRYYVHNFSQDGNLKSSGGTVIVTDLGNTLKTIEVSSATGSTGEYWHVFDMVGDKITIVNEILTEAPKAP